MRSMTLVAIAMLLVIMALAVLAVACNNGEATQTTTNSTTTTSVTTPSTTTTTQTTPPEETTVPDEPLVANPELNRTTAEKLKEMLDSMKVNTDFVIVDTRDGGSYANSHIQGAVNISYSPNSDPFEREMTYMVLPMNKPVVVYCA
jgi:hypothetical protein